MNTATHHSATQPQVNDGSAGRRATRWFLASLVLAVAASVGMSAWAHGSGPDGSMGGRGARHHMAGGLWGGSPERLGRMVDRMLDGLNATDAQRSQIRQIAQAAAADVKSQREAGRGLREKGMDIFTAPNVDPAAAEQLRQQALAQHDQVSRRMTAAMLDISRVLTPEQRAKLAQRMKARAEVMQERRQRERQQPR
jgi:protein CpxP